MRRRTFFFLGLSGATGCQRDTRPRLNVFNWSNYVGPDTIPRFEREYHVRVRYAIYESNEEMMARVMTGNSGWDVVFPSNYYVRPMRENRLLAELDHGRLSRLGNLDAPFARPAWDLDLRHCIPYMWGASGILYRPEVQPAPKSWSDLWSPRLRGRLTMLDDPAEVLGACLLKLGFRLNAEDPEQLRRAQQEAVAQKALLRAYLNAEVRDQVVAGDVLAAQLWATTSQQAIDSAPALRFAYPAEGFALYADNAVILRESKRSELSHEFLNYLLRPEVAAEIVMSTRTATANAAARDVLPEAARRNEVLYPPASVVRRGQWFETLPARVQQLRDRLWTEIKSA